MKICLILQTSSQKSQIWKLGSKRRDNKKKRRKIKGIKTSLLHQKMFKGNQKRLLLPPSLENNVITVINAIKSRMSLQI
jgi:hypothetical protein